jgi:hypothetical protein
MFVSWEMCVFATVLIILSAVRLVYREARYHYTRRTTVLPKKRLWSAEQGSLLHVG